MKRFASIFAVLSIMILSNACINQNINHTEGKDKLGEVQGIQNESMGKYREWSKGQGCGDSTQVNGDSTSLKLVGRSLQL
ncbi:hypothetical protein [Flagellimonas oceanensis]|uniref:hypothetical protein n=1 Tax=Flagellimonas oceanensis TaxID=2499163 RepID=UPI000F8D47BB|nr:hypothetical protein [Allomuricauda oceanensis]